MCICIYSQNVDVLIIDKSNKIEPIIGFTWELENNNLLFFSILDNKKITKN